MHISHWLALAVEKGELTLPDAGNGEHRVSGQERVQLRLAGSVQEGVFVIGEGGDKGEAGKTQHGAIVEVLR